MTLNDLPTVFHITHVKSGSQWVRQILNQCAPNRLIEPKVKVAQFYEDPLVPGAIHPTIYVPRPSFEAVISPKVDIDPDGYQPSPKDDPRTRNWYNFQVKKLPVIKFIVIRDLRDTLVSLYFSLKVSHRLISENVAEGRRKLNELSFEDGFLYLLGERGRSIAKIQSSWLESCRKNEALLIRYENLIADEQDQFARIVDYCQLDVPSGRLEKIVSENSFSKRAGRKPGEEDISSHYRKGISGDWRNHFTERIKVEFKQKYDQLLIETGYEKDLDW